MRSVKNKIVLLSLITIIFLTMIIYSFQMNGRQTDYTSEQILVKKKQKYDNLQLDTRSAPIETVLYQHISKEIPYLPIEDLNNKSNTNRFLNRTCAWYPKLLDVQVHNNYWQKFQNTNITYYIFGAYLDTRSTVVQDGPVVRVLTAMHFIAAKDEEYPKTYCQFWYEEQRQPIIMPANSLQRLWHYGWGHKLDHMYGHFISCPLPEDHREWIPRTVSLVAAPCDKATNNVRVTYEPLEDKQVKQGFAVCFKGLDFPYADLSHRLVEYVETLRLLGVDKLIMYELQVHPNMTKVLQYYEQLGFIEYRPFSFAWEAASLPEYRHLFMEKSGYYAVKQEVIPYNDCFYRNMYRYEYIVNTDLDEVLMPLRNFSNWRDLADYAENIPDKKCKKFASFCFRCTTFPNFVDRPQHYTNEIPNYFYMLQHVYRVKEHIKAGSSTKCFHNTDRVIATHNHLSFHHIKDICSFYTFNTSDAQLQHYRNKIHSPAVKGLMNDSIIDKSLWRLKDDIIENSMKVFEDLHFFKEIDSED